MGHDVKIFRRAGGVKHGAGGAYGYGSVEMAARAGNNVDGENEAEGGRGRGSDEGKGGQVRKEVLRLMEREAWRS